MTSKTFTLSLLMIALFVLLFATLSLNALTSESVFQATDRYAVSGHADQESISFTFWDDNDPPLVPADCAKCHGTPGFLDYLGEDGSTPGIVNRDAPIGAVITCIACHNPSAHALERIAFHSGAEFEPVGTEAACMACHQSRGSTDEIQMALQGLVDDAVSSDLTFINPHYNFAASTQLGSVARSGYEYSNREYAGYFAHAAGAETCTDCHNPHSLAVEPNLCAVCHANVVGREDFTAIRMQPADYDGDLDTREGISGEIASLQALLLAAIQEYARSVPGKPIVYADQFPYFFIDLDDNGIAEAEEVDFGNRYNAWTPRLIKAAYNYQFAKKDPGGYVHNPRYVIQLLYDSLMDLDEQAPQLDARPVRP